MSSILARRAGTGPGVAAYGASKGAVEQLIRELARQWAPHGIRVNALAPGFFPTAMNAPMVADPGRLAQLVARIPLGRVGRARGPGRGGRLPRQPGRGLHHRPGHPARRRDDLLVS